MDDVEVPKNLVPIVHEIWLVLSNSHFFGKRLVAGCHVAYDSDDDEADFSQPADNVQQFLFSEDMIKFVPVEIRTF